MKTLRIGVIGTGVIATTKHIPNLLKREDVKITMLCDLDTAKAEKAKESAKRKAEKIKRDEEMRRKKAEAKAKREK